MSLRLICGRSGTGKSAFCFEEIKNRINNKEKIYIITPEQFSATAEQKLLEKLECGSSLQAEVLTFARMAYRVMQEVGGVGEASLSKAGQAMLIYDILEKEKKNLAFLGKSSQNIELVKTQLTELKKHAVTVEMLKQSIYEVENRYLQEKLKDIITIYEKHQNKLKGKYIEENDRLEILSEQLEKTDMFKNSLIYIDEFTGFTKQEYKIIEKLLKTAKQISITITTDNLDMQTYMESLFYSNKQTADKLLYLAKKNEIKCEKTVFLEETYRFKTKELKHLEENLEKIPYINYKEKVENILLFLAKNPYSEVEYVAKEIYKLVKNKTYRFKDIVVMTKNIESYGSLCKAIFKEYDIPIFLDEKKELSQNEFARYILSLLEVYAKNWSYEAVIEYIKTGFVDITEEEIYEFENYTKKWGIKGSKWYKAEWNFGEQENEKIKEKAEHMLEIRKQVINPLISLKQKLVGTKKVKQINEALYQFLVENKVQEKIEIKQKELEEQGKEELAKEQEAVWNIFINLLDEINELFEEDNISFEKYREILKVGLEEAPLGKIPQSQDQVMVGTLDRTRTHRVKVVFIIGMNDGVFPSIQKNEGFLNDADRIALKEKGVELAKGSLENLYEDNLNIYKALTTAEEKIYFSYPSSNLDGGALRPSTYITKLKKLFPNIQEGSDVIEEPKVEILNENDAFKGLITNLRKKQDGEKISKIWEDVEGYFTQKREWNEKLESVKKALYFKNEPETITKENIQKLYGNTIVTSISKLEQYQSCPFSYYLKYGLKLKKTEEYQMQLIETGTFMHEVIDAFFRLTRERDLDAKMLEEEELEEIISEIIEEKLGLSKYYIFTSSEKFQILTNKLKRVVMQSMKYIIEGLKNSDFEVFANELEFKKGEEYRPITINLDDGKKVEITGKIDRIDMAKTAKGNYIRIIDYKSSVKNIDLNQVVAGLQIQLLTYLDAICNIEEVLPAGVLYYSLIDPILKTDRKITKEQIEDEMKKKFKMNGLILADVNVVKMMDKTLEKGASNIIPAYLDREGNISNAKSNTVTTEQFENLRKYTNKIIKQIAEEILKGRIEIEPYYQRKNQKKPCDYCEYKDICNFKEYGCNNYRYIPNDKKEDVLEKISK